MVQAEEDGSYATVLPPSGRGNVGHASSRSASAWAMSDDVFGQVVGAPLRFTPEAVAGVHYGVAIASTPYTYTPAHIEDLMKGAVNDLLFGAWKVWYFVPRDHADDFISVLTEKYGPQARAKLFAKQLRPVLSVDAMTALGVKLVFQPPGYTVLSLPGTSYHWTVSLGASVAEAANFCSSLGGLDMNQVRLFWLLACLCCIYGVLTYALSTQLHELWLAEGRAAAACATGAAGATLRNDVDGRMRSMDGTVRMYKKRKII